MKLYPYLCLGALAMHAAASDATDLPTAIPKHQANNPWFQAGASRIDAKAPSDPAAKNAVAKNVIVMLGDGMGMSTVTAARILAGQLQGTQGEQHELSFDRFPYTGLARTYNVDAQVPDSAGTATAIMTGVKTDAGVLGVDEDVRRRTCSTVAGNELVTALELAEIAGRATGFVTTTRVTHATPAATYAKTAERDWEDISSMPAAAVATGCTDIAVQLIEFEASLKARYPTARQVDGIDVVMGGGRRHFLPANPAFNSPDAISEIEGKRSDGRNLIAEWQRRYPTGTYIFDRAGFDALSSTSSQRVFALFNESHMRYEADRGNDQAGEPALADMAVKAIDVLNNKPKGFFLLVESGRIDHGHHATNAYNALTETVEFSRTVQAVVDAVDLSDTLIIVTADHSHVFTIGGYPRRGNPILGKVVPPGALAPTLTPALAADGLPYTTLGYVNGRGFLDLGDETDADVTYQRPIDAGRKNLNQVDTTSSGFHQEALVPLGIETHGGEDVVIYGHGPGAHLVSGTHEQNVIFHLIDSAAALTKSANAALAATVQQEYEPKIEDR